MTEAPAAQASAPVRAGLLANRPWAAVIVLMLLTVVNYLDRLLPGVLAEPLKHDLGLSDTFLGVLNGVAFLAVFAVAGLPIAKLSDRGRYGAVISGSLAFWSGMTALGGFAATGWQLAATRMGVALGEAGSTPAAHAYISRVFPAERRAAALAVFSVGGPLGGMAGLIIGGMIGERLGWRMTFLTMGAIGLLLSPLLLLALGPGAPAAAQARTTTKGSALALLRKPSVLALLAATSFIAMAGYSGVAFSPAFLMRAHGMSIGAVGLQLGLMQGAIGVTALLATGWIASRLGQRDERWILGVLILLITLCLPFAVAAYLVKTSEAAIVCIAVASIVPGAYSGLTVACLHSLAPPDMRARASALLMCCAGLFGSLGPLAVGALSDALESSHGEASLARAMLLAPVGLALSALCYAAAIAFFRRDVAEDALNRVAIADEAKLF